MHKLNSRPAEDRRLSGWLHTEVVCPLEVVTHSSTYWAHHRVT